MRFYLGLLAAGTTAFVACATANNGEHDSQGTTAALAAESGPPSTNQVVVEDDHHGIKVGDPYRWLENWDDPAVRTWSSAQNVYARSILDQLPNVSEIQGRVKSILAADVSSYGSVAYRAGVFFAKKRQPPKQQPFLIALSNPDAPEDARVIVDPNELDASGGTSIDWYVPSVDGKLVAVSLSKGGSESGDVSIFEVATGKRLFETIPRVNGGTAGGDLAWLTDGSGFFYTRYPRSGERPAEDMSFFQQLYFHKLGTPTADDRYELGKRLPRIAEIKMDMDHRSGRLLVTVQKGDGGEFAHFLRGTDGRWKQFSVFGDKIVQAAFGPKDDLFVVSRRDAPRGKVLRLPIEGLNVAKAKTIIPEGKDTVVTDFWRPATVVPMNTRVYVTYQVGGPSEIRAFDLAGRPKSAPKQLPVSAVSSLTPLAGDDILFKNESFVQPVTWYRFTADEGTTEKTRLLTDSPVDLSGAVVVRELATSKDGTKIPVNIIMPEGTELDGTRAVVVNGYGGYGVNLTPRFRATTDILLERGVIYVVANLRGGGEFGERWHRQGSLANKQNVFDDFAAVLTHLVDKGYASPKRIGIVGGSNGGLLMGATMVQHPALVSAVVSFVGIYDMLRVELSPNGAFNVTEFGTVKNPEHFQAMLAYSPYHNVKDATPYPPTLFLTGANDPRVDPMQSRKMCARLQAASSSGAPIILRTSDDSGHGGATPLLERIAQTVDMYAFLFDALGVKY